MRNYCYKPGFHPCKFSILKRTYAVLVDDKFEGHFVKITLQKLKDLGTISHQYLSVAIVYSRQLSQSVMAEFHS